MLVGAGMAHNVGMDEFDFLPAQAAELAVAPPPVRRLSFVTAEGRTISALQYGDAETGGFPDPVVTLLHGAGLNAQYVKAKLTSAMHEVMKSPTTLAQFKQLSVPPYDGSIEDMPVKLKKELEDFQADAKKQGLEPQ